MKHEWTMLGAQLVNDRFGGIGSRNTFEHAGRI
jgi:hypothetical protein